MRHILVVVLASALVACSDGSGPDPRARVAGTWQLVSVDGDPVPFVLRAGPPQIELMSIELELPSTAAGTETRTFRTTPAGGAPSTSSGSTEIAFEINGDQVTIINTESGLPDDVGTLDNGTLTISRSVFNEYREHVYQKQ